MKPLNHVIASAFAGAALLFFTKSVYAGLLCFVSGVVVDIDHAIEYVIHYGWKTLTLRNVYRASESTCKRDNETAFKKLHLVFHAYEIAVLFWIAVICTRNIYLTAIALGYSLHLLLDCVGNPTYLSTYSIFWRAAKKFDSEKLYSKN